MRNTIKSIGYNTKYDEKHTWKYEIGLKAHLKIRNTMKRTRENTKYDKKHTL